MGEERFPFDTPSPWVQETDTKLKWCAALEFTGPENVRLILGQIPTGARSSISVGEVSMAKGYAEQWLAWHDRRKADRESAFRSKQIFWTRWAAIVASLIALGAVLNWMWNNFEIDHHSRRCRMGELLGPWWVHSNQEGPSEHCICNGGSRQPCIFPGS